MPPYGGTQRQDEEYELRPSAHREVTDPKVLGWRLDEFGRMGFTVMQATTLAIRAEVDLHEAKGLVDAAKAKGTPLYVVFDILS